MTGSFKRGHNCSHTIAWLHGSTSEYIKGQLMVSDSLGLSFQIKWFTDCQCKPVAMLHSPCVILCHPVPLCVLWCTDCFGIFSLKTRQWLWSDIFRSSPSLPYLPPVYKPKQMYLYKRIHWGRFALQNFLRLLQVLLKNNRKTRCKKIIGLRENQLRISSYESVY